MTADGEQRRVELLARIFGARDKNIVRGIGDDAAVVKPRGGVTVTSVDAVAEGAHFSRDTIGFSAIGHKAAAAALSDLAAMGAEPGELYVSAGLPADITDTDFATLAHGIEKAARKAGASAVGGNMTRAKDLWVSITAVGYAGSVDDLVMRAGARPGDLVAVTGTLGGAAAALALLEGRLNEAGLKGFEGLMLRAFQLAPEPRIAAGRVLARAGATSMIDVSDGLARDAAQLARAGEVRIEIELEAIPLCTSIDRVAEHLGVNPHVFAAESGEEYQLLCTLAPGDFERAAAAVKDAGSRLTPIGKVVAAGDSGPEAVFLGGDGGPVAVAGYEHFD